MPAAPPGKPGPQTPAHARAADAGKSAPPEARRPAKPSPARPRPIFPPAPSTTFAHGPDLPERVRAVLDVVAPLLGLDPAHTRVTLAPGPDRPHGYARADGIRLTGALDPATPPSRSLIVHELAHLAQHRNRATSARAPDVRAAEAEAGGLAEAARLNRPLWTPRQVLPDGHEARDTGVSGIALDTEAERDLESLVVPNHRADLGAVADRLDPKQGAGGGENALRVLSATQFVVIRALVRSLRPELRLRLAHLDDSHHQEFPEACVAVLAALTPAELGTLPPGVLHGVDPRRLSGPAHRALLGTLARLPAESRAELEHGDKGALFAELFRTPPDAGSDAAEITAALRAERAAAGLEIRPGAAAGLEIRPGAAAGLEIRPGAAAGLEIRLGAAAGLETRPGTDSPAGRTGPLPPAYGKGPAASGIVPTEPGPAPTRTGEAGAEPEGAEGRPAPRPVELLMPPAPAEPGPRQRDSLRHTSRAARTAATTARTLPSAPESVQAARGAVTEPAVETKARAGQQLADRLGSTDAPSPELLKLGDEIVAAIRARRPVKVENLTKSTAQAAAAGAGQTLTPAIGRDTERVRGSYAELQTPPTGTPTLTPSPVPTPAGAVADPGLVAGSVAPEAIPARDLSLDADRARVENQAAAARPDRPSAEPLQGTAPFSDIAAGRAELAGLAKTGPAEVARQQGEAIASAKADMDALQATALEALTTARGSTVRAVGAGQREMVKDEENTRARISAQAQKNYDAASAAVGALLTPLPGTAVKSWDAGLARLSTEFTDSLSRVQAWIDERHSGAGGWFVGKWDKWSGYPAWVTEQYDTAEQTFGAGIRALLLSISTEVQRVVNAAQAVVEAARQQNDALFTGLPKGLEAWAAQQRGGFASRLDGLSDQVAKARTAFVADLSQRAVASVADVRQKVEELREAAKGVIGRIRDAIEAFLADPVKAIIEGLLTLLHIPPKSFWALVDKIAAVLADIADDPQSFINHLVDGLAQGFELFFSHFPDHLIKSFWNWLFSGLGPVGVQLPPDFTPRSLFAFALQLMGLTWPNIREILVRHVGAHNVDLIEKVWGFVNLLIEKGPAGLVEMIEEKLAPATLLDMIFDAAVDYLTSRLIKIVTVRVLAMFNPVGAVLQAIELIYKVLTWVFNNAATIFTLIETVVNGIADVLAGNVGKLALAVEKALAGLLPTVIDFLTDWAGLGDLPLQIAELIKDLQTAVLKIVDQLIGALVERGRAILASLGLGGKGEAGEDDELGSTVRFSAAGETHKLWVEEAGAAARLMVASMPEQLTAKIKQWRAKIAAKEPADNAKRAQAATLLDRLEPIADESNTEAAALSKEFLAAKAKQGDEHKPPSDDELENRERAIAVLLDELFELFGEKIDVEEILKDIAKHLPGLGQGRQRTWHERWLEQIAEIKIGNDEKAKRLWPDTVMGGTQAGGLAYLAEEPTHRRLLPYFTTAPGERSADTGDFDDFAFVEGAATHTVRRDFRTLLGEAVKQRLRQDGTQNLQDAFDRKVIDDLYQAKLQKRIEEISFVWDYPGGGRFVLPTERIPDHTKFRPLDLIGPKEVNGVRTTKYRTVVGQEFVIVTDASKGLQIKAGGSGLRMMSGRGVTEDSPAFTAGQDLNRAHLIANEFGGSGFAEGDNLITTSAYYNQVTMREAERLIGASIKKYAEDNKRDHREVVFELDVTVSFGALRDTDLLDQIKKDPDFPAALIGTNLDAMIVKMIREKEIHKDLMRVTKITYVWTAALPPAGGRPAPKTMTRDTFIGADEWLLING
ncbi:DNA/RNA non-specific endonuclease [Actinoplanes sp. NPDC026619]|uniref:DNA/RNA non-specific endonuclease n=1 Tax=Actinoplanes sp. NPDC026619 TaxID=3155798 RepID=UPI00340B39F0